MNPLPGALLARMRLAAQRLAPETAASGPVEAARAVLGIQAQDVRAMGLSLRSRVPRLDRDAVLGHPGLIRTWTVRGTVHLIDVDDLPLLHALTGPRNARVYDNLMSKRGSLDLARSLLSDIVDVLGAGPLTRAALLARLAERGRPTLDRSSINVLMPWAAMQGVLVGLPDGRFRASDPPPTMDPDEALGTLAARYLAGYGPAGPEDLARWSGLPLGLSRRAFAAAGELEAAGDLLALPGTLDAAPPVAPPVLLLAAFDTSMLGWRTREPLVAAADDHHVLPGGGIVRATVLARGRAAGTWRLGGGSRRRLDVDWFRRRPAARALGAELADVGRFLGLQLAS